MMRVAKPLTRIYFPGPLHPGQTVVLAPAAAHHVARVLRLAAGDALTLFNGTGGEYAAELARVTPQEVAARVTRFSDLERESPLTVTLAQGISSGERMDYTVQKAVELGVAVLQPLATARSVVRLAGERAERRVAHWQQVAIAACEQCGRNRLPEVRAILGLAEWLGAGVDAALRLALVPGAPRRLAELPQPHGPVVLVAGPEGGLSEDEHHLLTAAGFTAANLGPRVLRTETAAAAALAVMQARWGDF